MTPGVVSIPSHFRQHNTRTERVPEDQSQLRNLFSLLAQFQKSSLTRGRLHELGYPLQDAPVLLRHSDVGGLDVVRGAAGDGVVAGKGGAIAGGELLVVLSLGSRLNGLGLLLLSVQLGGLGLVLSVLAYMVLRLLVMAMGLSLSGPVAVLLLLLLLLLREEMLHWPRLPTGSY